MMIDNLEAKASRYLRELLSIHWLRPETALWRVFDCLLMDGVTLPEKSVDLGCGDGTLSFIAAGGKITDYDVYQQVRDLNSFTQGTDIYNKLVQEDFSIACDTKNLRYRFAYGIDHKDGLISKASKLDGFYHNTKIQNLNQRLDFDMGTFEAGFSNILYWLDNPSSVLAEWHRVLAKGARLYLFVSHKTLREKAWFYYAAPHSGARRYYNYFDRGYNALNKHSYDSTTWEKYFTSAGFQVVKHKKYLTDPVMDIWNIGTRPISSLLIGMANRLGGSDREQVKREWIDFFHDFFLPIVLGEFDKEPGEDEYAFHYYVLEK
jgi:SAM-dependent methyltransferase